MSYQKIFEKKNNIYKDLSQYLLGVSSSDPKKFFKLHFTLFSSGDFYKMNTAAKNIFPVLARFCTNQSNSYQLNNSIIAGFSGYKNTSQITKGIKCLEDLKIIEYKNVFKLIDGRRINAGNVYRFLKYKPFTDDKNIFPMANILIDKGVWASFNQFEKSLYLYILSRSKRVFNKDSKTFEPYLFSNKLSVEDYQKSLGISAFKIRATIKSWINDTGTIKTSNPILYNKRLKRFYLINFQSLEKSFIDTKNGVYQIKEKYLSAFELKNRVIEKSVIDKATKIMNIIRRYGKGWAFSKKDFFHISNENKVSKILDSLVKESKIRKLNDEIYDYPMFSKLLNKKVGADIYQVSQAIARKYSWDIQPSGNIALNRLKLSTQVPTKLIFFSDGPSKEYKIGNQKIIFKNTDLEDTKLELMESRLLVQAIKALGKERIDLEIKKKLGIQFSLGKLNKIIKDIQYIENWIYEVIKEVHDLKGKK